MIATYGQLVGMPSVMKAIEPLILTTITGKAFYASHRDNAHGSREYRVGTFLKYGQFEDKFISGWST